MNICVIPARGGSRRIPNKNRRLFYGKPIIAYSIEAAKESGLFRRIVVTTDDPGVAVIAKYYGAQYHERPPALAGDEVGTQEVARDVLVTLEAQLAAKKVDWAESGETIKAVCTLYATAPMVSVDNIKDALFHLEHSEYIQHVVPVGKWLEDPGQFYCSHAYALRDNSPLLSMYTMLLPIDPRRCCDINTENDWIRAEVMYAETERKT